jgi:5-hydroxyisourate hydrolase-like protein (transthyretin family)
MRISPWFSIVGTLLLAGIPGCGGGAEVDAVPVSGVVKINGEPADRVAVAFFPQAASVGAESTDASGVTDATGRFDLSIPITGQKGAMPGTYRVQFLAGDYPKESPDGAPQVYEPIPPKYNLDSEVTFEVPADGTDQANFDLEIPNFKRTP